MARGLNPGSVDIFEIYQNREVQIDPALYAENADTWITGTDLCLAFQNITRGTFTVAVVALTIVE